MPYPDIEDLSDIALMTLIGRIHGAIVAATIAPTADRLATIAPCIHYVSFIIIIIITKICSAPFTNTKNSGALHRQ